MWVSAAFVLLILSMIHPALLIQTMTASTHRLYKGQGRCPSMCQPLHNAQDAFMWCYMDTFTGHHIVALISWEFSMAQHVPFYEKWTQVVLIDGGIRSVGLEFSKIQGILFFIIYPERFSIS